MPLLPCSASSNGYDRGSVPDRVSGWRVIKCEGGEHTCQLKLASDRRFRLKLTHMGWRASAVRSIRDVRQMRQK